jgi:hypothetical protein
MNIWKSTSQNRNEPTGQQSHSQEQQGEARPSAAVNQEVPKENEAQTYQRQERSSPVEERRVGLFQRFRPYMSPLNQTLLTVIALGGLVLGYLQYISESPDQRPRVAVGNIRIVGPVVASKGIMFSMELTNTGKDPALEVRLPAWWGVIEPPSRESFAIPASHPLQEKSFVVPPLTTITSTLHVSGDRITEELVAAINKGEVPLYVYGELPYTDASGHHYKTYVCAVFRHTGEFPRFSELCSKSSYNHME